MLKVRVIPTLLWKGPALVKGVGFDSWRQVGTVLPAIKVYNLRDVDELVLLDILATEEKRNVDYDELASLAEECFVPLTVGGGVHDIKVIRDLLLAGADKVVINSAAYENPDLVREASNLFGRQCIVVSIDAKITEDGEYRCYSNCGRLQTGREPGEWARQLEKLGAGEILITSIDRDGTMDGFDLELIKRVSSSVGIPVIAAGGGGKCEDFHLAIEDGSASAVAAASIFHFTEVTPREIKEYLAGREIPVRLGINSMSRGST